MTKRGTYQERLLAFAAQASIYTEARVEHPGKPWTECSPGEEPYWTGRTMPATNGRAACQCCGSRRVKVVYPVLPDGDLARVQWIGAECWENLNKAGKIRLSLPGGYRVEV